MERIVQRQTFVRAIEYELVESHGHSLPVTVHTQKINILMFQRCDVGLNLIMVN